MSTTDPIADLLTRIRNAHIARHKDVQLPTSKIKASIVKILQQEGYVDDFEVIEGDNQGTLRIHLKYGKDGRAAIEGIQRVSRPGRRVYSGKDGIPKVLNGLGVTILSTPRGVMTATSCRRQGIGGELLCNIW